MVNGYKKTAEKILENSGVVLNGSNPWDIQVKNENFYKRVLGNGSLGLGESYMDGMWDTNDLETLVYKMLKADLPSKAKNFKIIYHFLKARAFNLQKKSRATEVAEKHYDIGNDLYQKMLGPTMVYTCGYWQDSQNLAEAQIAKMDLVCRKLALKPGMKILDIGCGFGSFMKFAAEKYGVTAVGVSVSKEQTKFGKEFCKNLPIEFIFQDYRDITGQYDRVLSIGMMEAVGYKNFKTYFSVVSKVLKNDGLFLLHTIGNNVSEKAGDPWLAKYIFPNGLLPSLGQLTVAMEGLFVLEDLHNFGADYEKTLLAWFENFDAAWPELSSKYNERFYRMWKYYLLQCAGIFKARNAQLWQMVLSKNGVSGGYKSIR